MRRKRALLTREDRAGFSRIICSTLGKLIRDRRPRRFFAFAPTPAEPNLWPLYRRLIRRRCQVAFPRVIGPRLSFVIVSSISEFRPGLFGISEPTGGRDAKNPGENDLLLIPCLGLSLDGYRLGHGGGYYDRWLGQTTHGFRAGVLFHCQITRYLPHTQRDARVDAAVTERSIRFFA